ncbi:MAG: hypothetical protein ACLRM9_06510 [Collinsella aerofaciens]
MVKINRKWAVVTCLMALLDLGQFAGSRLGVGLTESNGHGSYPRFPARRGLPYEWVTNFVVRKCAHFTEYMVLGIHGNARL